MTEHPTDTSTDAPNPSGTPIGYPSIDLPAPPPFRMLVPEGWKVVPSTEAEAILIDPVETDGFRTNVVIQATKVFAVENPRELLAHNASRLASRNDVTTPRELVQAEFKDDNTCVVTLRRQVAVGSTPEEPEGPLAMPTEDETETVEIEQVTFLSYVHGPRIGFLVSATGSYTPTAEGARDTTLSAIRSIIA